MKKTTIDEEDVFSSAFSEIRKDYMTKKENTYSLYAKYYKKYNINKDVFLSIINLLKVESNQPIKKQPKKINIKKKDNSFDKDNNT